MQSVSVSRSMPREPLIGPTHAWFLHLWAFALPALNMAFLLSGPHSWRVALIWALPIWLLVAGFLLFRAQPPPVPPAA